jgi:glycosyltransferase involved in cell wall biosynthesis
MRITCVIGTLGGGGAERVMTYLCGGLASRGHEVTLLTLDDSVPDFYTLPAQVKRERVSLPTFKKAGFWGGFPRLWKLTCAVRRTRPDVLISFMTISVLASCWLLHIPAIYADHLDIRHLAYSRKWKILRNLLLGCAKNVTVLSERDRKFISLFHSSWKPVVIYNPALPLEKGFYPRPIFMQAGKKYVIAVGRLVKQKGFDRLLEAWRRVCEDFPQWRLCIIGAGEDEKELKGLADTLDVQYCVDFVPPQQGLTAVYRHAQIYAMSSRAEGFPMVLLEAMAAGIPAVSFDCTGPNVIIRDGVDGFLVKQNYTERLAAKLAELMKDESLREKFGKKAQEVTKRFSLNKYLDAYENLCREAIK